MSFGGGSDPSGTTFQTQFTRDAPQIEAAKMGLMDTAQQYTRFGQNPWELSHPEAKIGEEGFGKYAQGAGGTYAEGTKWEDLTRGQRVTEGQAGGPGGIPTQQVAAFAPQQQEAFNRATQGLGSYQPYLDQAKGFTESSTAQYDPTGQTAGQARYQDYMNPYQSEVIGGIQDQFTKLQNQAAAQAGQVGSFGGARQGVQAAELGTQQAKTVGQAQAQNYGQAQQQAQQAFASQMGRYGQAGQQMAGLGAQQQQQGLGDIASLMSAGSVQQQQQQQFLDAQYQQQLQQLYEPYQRLGFTSDIYQGMPSSAMAISMGTSPGSNPLAQTVGAGIAGLGAYQGFKAGG
jgi:hypothetical protein